MIDCIERYFPSLSAVQIGQFAALGGLYADWNAKINVISRKDIDNLYERHILHSLGISLFLNFKPGSSIMDVGTGGGFPGIPLAILYPEVHVHLVDSIGKKLKVAQSVATTIGLTNISVHHCRVEDEKGLFDFVVSRAVMPLPDLIRLCRKNISTNQRNALPNGIICLKGGELHEELKSFKHMASEMDLSKHFKEDYFNTKKVVYLPVNQTNSR